MTLPEACNRTVNLVATSIVGLSGAAFLPEVIFENDLADKLDDGVLFLLAVAAVWWYRRARKRFSRSIAPVVFMGLSLITKIAAILVEFDDKESIGDDFGALILFLLSFVLVWYLYRAAGKSDAALEEQYA